MDYLARYRYDSRLKEPQVGNFIIVHSDNGIVKKRFHYKDNVGWIGFYNLNSRMNSECILKTPIDPAALELIVKKNGIINSNGIEYTLDRTILFPPKIINVTTCEYLSIDWSIANPNSYVYHPHIVNVVKIFVEFWEDCGICGTMDPICYHPKLLVIPDGKMIADGEIVKIGDPEVIFKHTILTMVQQYIPTTIYDTKAFIKNNLIVQLHLYIPVKAVAQLIAEYLIS